jgi:flavin reductase (DIM6/NTAB) family NADH-FMN oxidoreductase RutF
MQFDMEHLEEDARYRLLTALVIPRPIAWITTRNDDGSVNLAPYSFFNVLGNTPPIVAFGPSEKSDGVRKDTARNILERGDFVVHIADRELAEQVQKSAARLPYGVSEVEALGLNLMPSTTVATPRLKEAKVALECTFEKTVVLGDNEIFFGRVVTLHAPPSWFDGEGRLVPGSPQAIGRLQGPGWYCTTSEQFNLGPMPSAKSFEKPSRTGP